MQISKLAVAAAAGGGGVVGPAADLHRRLSQCSHALMDLPWHMVHFYETSVASMWVRPPLQKLRTTQVVKFGHQQTAVPARKGAILE